MLVSHRSESKQGSSRFSVQTKVLNEFIVNHCNLNQYRVKKAYAVRWSWSIRGNFQHPPFKKFLILATKQAKFIQEFQIELCYFSDKELNKISRSLKRFCALKTFSIKIAFGYRVTDRGLRHLSKGLKKLSGLQSLNFCFYGFTRITKKGLKILGRIFGMHIFSLKNARLCLYDCGGLTNSGMRDVSKGLKNLLSGQKFILELAPCDGITKEGMLNLKKSIQELKTFKKVDVYFEYYYRVSISQVIEVIQNFGTLPSLQNVAICFVNASRPIIHLEFNHLAQGIESLMIPFDENFPFRLMGSEFDILARFPGLKSVFFQFEPKFAMDDFRLKCLGKNLKCLKSLQNLTLKFFMCFGITDEGMETFSESLRSHTKIRGLAIEFHTCFGITDRGLRYLGKSLEGRLALRNLVLGFRCCKKITDEGIYFLSKSVESLVYLQNADFDFSYIPKISDSAIQSFPEKLRKLVALKKLTLWFSRAQEIGGYAKEKIIEDLKNHVSLQKAYLNFDEKCPLMIDVLKERVHLEKEKGLKPSLSYLLEAGLVNCLKIGRLVILGGLGFKESSELYDRVNKALLFVFFISIKRITYHQRGKKYLLYFL